MPNLPRESSVHIERIESPSSVLHRPLVALEHPRSPVVLQLRIQRNPPHPAMEELNLVAKVELLLLVQLRPVQRLTAELELSGLGRA